jgi:hypothetical protein
MALSSVDKRGPESLKQLEGPLHLVESHERFTQDTLSPELTESIWLSHDELLDLFTYAHAQAEYVPAEDDKVHTCFLEEPDFETMRPVIGRFRPSEINTLEQVRSRYDVRRVQRIGKSIAEEGQLQNCGLAYQDEVHAKAYLHDLNRFFGTDYELCDLERNEQGHYVILIFGHNRDFGIRMSNLENNGHEDVGIGVEAKVYPNISFAEAIKKQFIENTGEAPPLYERAYKINAYVQSVAENNGDTPVSVLAKDLNMSEGQVHDAMTYFSLPKGVKALVEVQDGGLSFSSALIFARLKDVCSEEEIQLYAERALENGFSGSKIEKTVKDIITVNGLPDPVRVLIHAGTFSFDRATQLRKLIGVIDNQTITELVLSACACNWDAETYRCKVDEVFNNARYRQEGIFADRAQQADAQQIADSDYWLQMHVTAELLLRRGLSALEGYISLGALSADRNGAVFSAVSSDQIQQILQTCQIQLSKLETTSAIVVPDELKEHYGRVGEEVRARLSQPIEDAQKPEALF